MVQNIVELSLLYLNENNNKIWYENKQELKSKNKNN